MEARPLEGIGKAHLSKTAQMVERDKVARIVRKIWDADECIAVWGQAARYLLQKRNRLGNVFQNANRNDKIECA